MAQPIFAEYIGQYHIEAIEFDELSLGTLSPIVYGKCIHFDNLNTDITS